MAATRDSARAPTDAQAPSRITPLPIRHALLLGLIHGPTEVLPISSSAHTLLVPHLLGWPAIPAEQRTTFEVALHAGSAPALAYALRRELPHQPLSPFALVAALIPPAAVGYLLEGRLDQRLGGARATAVGLHLGGVALALADLHAPRTRRAHEATLRDGLALGLAQALALLPGVSRNGATLTAARVLGFARADAQTLSWSAGLPVLLGATLLKGRRLLREPPPARSAAPLLVGALASLLSTRACAPLLAPARRRRALWPFALYRSSLAALAVRQRRARAAVTLPPAGVT